MAPEPINIFSRKVDPRGVLRILQSLSKNVVVAVDQTPENATDAGPQSRLLPEDHWTQADVILVKKGFLRSELKLCIGHNTEYYDGPDWPKQKVGMMNYFSSFPDSPNKPEIMRLINSFQFSLSVPSYDLDIESQDERLKLLFAVCRHLDGVFFTPSSLRDSAGRILISRFDPPDPNAVMPAIPLDSESGHDGSEEAGSGSDQGDEDDDEYARTPPSRERIIRRTLALTAVAARATLELDALNGDVDDGEIHRKRILDWVAACDINDELEPEEWKVLQRPVKKLQQQDFINSMWRVEGLVVLAWALHLHPMPVYDELVIPSDLYQSIGLFDAEAAQELHQKGTLRTDDELKEMHDHLLAFHWRLRDFSLRPNLMDFTAFSKECWFGRFDISRFRRIRGDIAIGNVALNKATPDEIGRVSSIAAERHIAIIWLHGQRGLYSEIEAHT